ncbi:hypothetical protein [Streptomyces sp. NPDC048419]|uniref:hypothetical protein n=1 Tax=Streptomyces sp. NPDC048419 TaxID=3365547 RepID=UPI0037104748
MTRTRPLLVPGLLVAPTAITAALAYELPKDGAVPDAVTVFGDTVPAVTRTQLHREAVAQY